MKLKDNFLQFSIKAYVVGTHSLPLLICSTVISNQMYVQVYGSSILLENLKGI